jgi:hypothetical protein
MSVGGIHETSLRWRVRYQFRHSWARHNISIFLLGLGKKVKHNQNPAGCWSKVALEADKDLIPEGVTEAEDVLDNWFNLMP